MNNPLYDLLIIGGGINGAGIARDAAGRGLSVLLCERDDLGQHTSSASTKLIHGGLRYLESYQFGLVRKALQEREILLQAAPHIIQPLRFVMPHDRNQRPQWLIRAGLFLYDHLARRQSLPASEPIHLADHPTGKPLHPRYKQAFLYSDAWVDDSRLVILNALDAALHGADIRPHTEFISACQQNDLWHCQIRAHDGQQQKVRARSLINAGGAWVETLLNGGLAQRSTHRLRLVKGSHIIVRQLFQHPYAYILQNPDQRITFAIPYQQDFTLIGTTDVDYQGDPAKVSIQPAEIDYLCTACNRYFNQQISAKDVVSTFSGVRPLLDDANQQASKVTRDYRLELTRHTPPLLTLFGGKITTYRKLAEQALDQLAPLLGNQQPAWTAKATLPGGDLLTNFEDFLRELRVDYPWLPETLIQRFARAYGTRIAILLQNKTTLADLGELVLPNLYAIEIDYLRRYEWAASADDILWRRSKLGLHYSTQSAEILTSWLQNHPF